MRVRFSIWPNPTLSFTDVLRISRHAADTGWDGVWFADHFMPNAGTADPLAPMLEAGSTLAALAAAVPRVRLGSLVYGNTYRHPAVLANMAATVDQISSGRFTLGVGAGWQENEHAQYGITLPPVRERIDRFAEALVVLRGLLTEPVTSFSGEHYRLDAAVCQPKPVQDRLPIMIGAKGEQRMLSLVAQHADQWNCWGLPDVFRHKSGVLDQHCETQHRDPASILRTAQAVIVPGTADEAATKLAQLSMPAFGGSPDQLTEVVAGYAAARLDELIVPTGGLGSGDQVLDAMDLLMTEVFQPATGAAGHRQP